MATGRAAAGITRRSGAEFTVFAVESPSAIRAVFVGVGSALAAIRAGITPFALTKCTGFEGVALTHAIAGFIRPSRAFLALGAHKAIGALVTGRSDPAGIAVFTVARALDAVVAVSTQVAGSSGATRTGQAVTAKAAGGALVAGGANKARVTSALAVAIDPVVALAVFAAHAIARALLVASSSVPTRLTFSAVFAGVEVA